MGKWNFPLDWLWQSYRDREHHKFHLVFGSFTRTATVVARGQSPLGSSGQVHVLALIRGQRLCSRPSLNADHQMPPPNRYPFGDPHTSRTHSSHSLQCRIKEDGTLTLHRVLRGPRKHALWRHQNLAFGLCRAIHLTLMREHLTVKRYQR